jgi:phosphatidylglycerophosphate synthase
MSATVQGYRDLCQKGSEENYLFDRYLVRHLSLPVTIVFLKLGIQPNTVTALSLVAVLSSLWFLTLDTTIGLSAAAALIFTYYLLDHVDGELARYYIRTGARKTSLGGQYFDVLCHSYSTNVMLFFIGVGAWRSFGYEWAVLLGFFACIAVSHFPMLVAARTFVQRVGREPDAIFRDDFKTVLQHLELKGQQVAAVRASWRSWIKWKKLALEMLTFPGLLILIMIVALLDAFLPAFTIGGMGVNFRLLLLLWMTGFGALQLVRSFRKWFALLRGIA